MPVQKPAAQQQIEQVRMQEELKNNNVKGNDTMENTMIINEDILAGLDLSLEIEETEEKMDNEFTRVIVGEGTNMLYEQLSHIIPLDQFVDNNGDQIIKFNEEEGIMKYQVNVLPSNIQYRINTFLYYATRNNNEVKIINIPLSESQITTIKTSSLNTPACSQDQLSHYAKFYFIYNGVDTDRIMKYPVLENGQVKFVLVALHLTQDEMKTIIDNSKSVAKKKAVQAKATKVGQKVRTAAVTGTAIAGALGTEAARTMGAVFVEGTKMATNMSLAFGSEITKGIDEMKNLDIKNNQDYKIIKTALKSIFSSSETTVVTENTLSLL